MLGVTDYRGDVRWFLINAHSMTPARASAAVVDFRPFIDSRQRKAEHPGAVASHVARIVRELAAQSKTFRFYRSKLLSALRAEGYNAKAAADMIHANPDLISAARERRAPIAQVVQELQVVQARDRARRSSRSASGTERAKFYKQVRERLERDYDLSTNAMDQLFVNNAALVANYYGKESPTEVARILRARAPGAVKRISKKRASNKALVSKAWAEKYLPENWTANVPSKTLAVPWVDAPAPRMCAARAVLGANKDWLQPIHYKGRAVYAKTYEICLTAAQAKRLFADGKPVTKQYGGTGGVAPGTYAGVWKRGDKDILKITKDAEDVGALLLTGGLRHVRRVSKAYELIGAGRDLDDGEETPVFAIISEDVQPINHAKDPEIRKYVPWMRRWWSGMFEPPGPMQRLIVYAKDYIANGRPVTQFSIPRNIRTQFYSACQWAPGTDASEDDCRKFSREFMDTWTKMARKGVLAWDMHEGNLGVSIGNRTKAGTWMIIDAGLSSREPPPDKVQELRAAWRDAHRSARRTTAWRGLAIVGVATAAMLIAPKLVE